MASPIVFLGSRASAEVVAGYLRQQSVPFVEVIPPTPYPAGPLGYALVRVEGDPRRARKLVLEPGLHDALPDPPFRLAVRLLAAFLVWLDVAVIL